MSFYSAGVGSILAPGAVDKLTKKMDELKNNAWAIKSAAATDAGILLARADQTAKKVSRAIVASAVVTGVSTFITIRAAVNAARGRA